MQIEETLGTVAITLMWSLVLAATCVFLYITIKWLQAFKKRVKKTSGRKKFEDLRTIITMLPFIWVVLNFNSDSNYIADVMFNLWLPVVIASILILGIAELVLPIYYSSKMERRVKK